MLQMAILVSFPLFSLIFFILSVSAANSIIYSDCSKYNYASMTPYESNLNSLFTSLVDSASVSNFNKFEISQSDVVYGLFQCRGDLRSSVCKECVANSVSQLKTTCSMSMSGTMQLDGCLVKYDNTSFFGTQDKMEVLKKCGPSIGYNLDVSNRISDALAYLIDGNGNYFRGGDFGSIQGVAQCVQDLSVSDCQDCLSEAGGRLRSECVTSSWGDMYLGKCYIQYANQGNSNNNPTNSDKHQAGGDIKNQIIGNIIAAVLSALVSTGVSYKIGVHTTNIYVEQKVAGIRKDVEEVKFVVKKKEEKKEEKKKAEKKKEEEKKKSCPNFYPVHMSSPYPCPYY